MSSGVELQAEWIKEVSAGGDRGREERTGRGYKGKESALLL